MGFKLGGIGGGAGKTTMPPPDMTGKGRQDIGPNGPRNDTNVNSTNGTSNGQSVDGKNGKGGKLGGNLLDFGLNAGSGALNLLGTGVTGGAGLTGGAGATGGNLPGAQQGNQSGGLLSSAGKGGGISQLLQQLVMLLGLQQLLKGGNSEQNPLQQAGTPSGGSQPTQANQGGVNGMIQQLQQMMQQMMQMMQQLTGMQQGGGNSAGAQSGGDGQANAQSGGGNMLSNLLNSALQMTGLNALMSLLGGGSSNGGVK
ncbi:hypothetical protein [Mixta sp. Marseille-Q2659]|uniref:hypothetical protein n=1 Tax=Mixta sp. Marseille-Q2659 TaxID=2736607 RepID=UPI0023B9FB2C|nr:hypothetical protein [Mixta sp. Marseille-Q2659]